MTDITQKVLISEFCQQKNASPPEFLSKIFYIETCCLGLMAVVYEWVLLCSTFRRHLCVAYSGWRRNVEYKRIQP